MTEAKGQKVLDGLFNAFLLESLDVKKKLFWECEKGILSKSGEGTIFARSKDA